MATPRPGIQGSGLATEAPEGTPSSDQEGGGYACTLMDRPATVIHYVEPTSRKTRWTVVIDADTVRAMAATDSIDAKGKAWLHRFDEQRCLVKARLREAGLCPFDWYFIDGTDGELLGDGSMAPSGYCRNASEPALTILPAPTHFSRTPPSSNK